MKKFYDSLSTSSLGRIGNKVDGKLWRSCCTFLMIVLCSFLFTDTNAAHVKVTGDFSSVDFDASDIEESIETGESFQSFVMVAPTVGCVAQNLGLNSDGTATLGWFDFVNTEDGCAFFDSRELTSTAPAGSFTIDPDGDGPDLPTITYDCNALGSHQLAAQLTCADGTDICWNDILIEDKIAPFICCPSTIQIECDVDNDGNPRPFAGWAGSLHSDDLPAGSGLGNFPITSPFNTVTGPFGIQFPAPIDCATASAGSDSQADVAAGYTGLPYVEENDACGGFTLTYSDVFATAYSTAEHDCDNHSYDIERTWTATDASGNASTCTQLIEVRDTQAPMLAGIPADLSIECGTDAPALANVTATDNCYLANVSLTSDNTDNPAPAAPGTVDADGNCVVSIITRVWSAQDACGNESSEDQNIYIIDTVAPVCADIALNGQTVSVGDDCIYNYVETFTATDACDDEIDFTWEIAEQSTGVIASGSGYDIDLDLEKGDYLVTCVATDDCGNSNSDNYSFMVEDATPAQIACQGNVILPTDAGECFGRSSDLRLDYVPFNTVNSNNLGEFADNCPILSFTREISGATVSAPEVTNNPSIGSAFGYTGAKQFQKGTSTVTYTIVDCTGEEFSCSFDVTVLDQEPATITCPAVPPTLTTSSDGTGDCEVCATQTAGFSGAYDHSNWTFAQFVDPTATLSGNLVDGTVATTPTSVTLTAPDDDVQGTFVDFSANSTYCTTVAASGILSFDYSVEIVDSFGSGFDPYGYTLDGSFVTLANADGDFSGSTGDIITGTASIAVNAGQEFCFIQWSDLDAGNAISISNMFIATTPISSLMPTISDNCPNPQVTSDLQECYGPGWNSITWTVEDCGGNISECTVDFMVVDDEDPTITTCPGDDTVDNDEGECSALYDISPIAEDNCEYVLNYTLTGATASSGVSTPNAMGNHPDLMSVELNVGVTTITFIAEDAAGNTSAPCSYTVTVNDTELPVLTCPADILDQGTTVDCTATVDDLEVSAEDNCCIANISYTVIDADGNADGPFDVSNGSTPDGDQMVDLSGYVFSKGENTVNVETWDCNGNGNACSFKVTVIDDDAPMINDCPSDIVKESVDGDCSALATWTEPTDFSDNCAPECPLQPLEGPFVSTNGGENMDDLDMGTMSNIQSNGNAFGIFPVGTRYVKYKLTDEAGNMAWCIFSVTVNDNEAPTAVACPSDFTINQDLDCNPTLLLGDYKGLPVFDDNCSIASISQVPAVGTSYTPADGMTIPVTVTATDGAGLSVSCSFTITVEDNSGPTIACPADQTALSSATASAADACALELPDYTGAATANNSCGNEVPTVTQSPAAGSTYAADDVVTVTLTATDGAGNQTSCSFSVTFEDDVDPTGVCAADPATATAAIGGCSANVTLTPPSVSDCGAVTIWGSRSDLGPDLTAANGYTGSFEACESTVTWYAQDAAGNLAEICSNTVSVVEPLNEANEPTAVCQGSLVLGLKNDGTVDLCADIFGQNSFDNCSNSELSYEIHIVGEAYQDCITFDCSHIGDNEVCLKVTDCSGNEDLCFTTITIQDKRDPFIQCPADIEIECHVDNGGAADPGAALAVLTPFSQTAFDNWNNVIDAGQDAAAGITGYAQGWDNCNGEVTFSDVSTRGNDPSHCDYYSYTITRTWTVADAEGNDNNLDGNNCVQTITVVDTQDPYFSEAEFALDVAIDCDNPNFASELDYALMMEPTPNDLCYVTMELVSDETQNQTGCSTYNGVSNVYEQRTRVWEATDACGNNAFYTQVISTYDNTAPAIDCPNGGEFAIYGTDSDGGADCEVFVSLNATATDCQEVTYTHQIKDSDTGLAITGVKQGADASDNYGAGNYCVQFWAADPCGNTSTCLYFFAVEDDTNPTIDCSDIQNMSASADEDECSYSQFAVQAPGFGDNCPGAFIEAELTGAWAEVFFNDDNIVTTFVPFGFLPTIAFPVGETTITWTAYDAAGNASGTCTQTVTITDDQAPSGECPEDVVLGTGVDGIAAYNCNAPYNFKSPILDENCELALYECTLTLPDGSSSTTATQNDASQTIDFPVGISTVSYYAEDAAGNPWSCSFTVTVSDNEAPIVICANTTIELDADGNASITPADVDGGSSDNCDLTLAVSQEDFDCTHLGVNTVTLTGTDAAGNSFECWADVTVEDNIDPTISCSDISLNTTETDLACGYTATEGDDPSIADNAEACGLTLVNDLNGTASIAGEAFDACDSPHTIVWTVTDGSGNSATCTQTITITDNEAPTPIARAGEVNCGDVIEKSADADNCNTSFSWIDFTIADFADNCDADGCGRMTFEGPISAVECLGEPGGLRTANFPVGSTTVSYFVTDASGNTYECTFTVNVSDDQDPEIQCPADQDLNVDLNCNDPQIPSYAPLALSDNCPGTTLTQSPAAGTSLVGAADGDTQLITLTATDASGNTSSCSFTVTIVDNVGTTIVCPDDLEETVDANCEATLGDYTGLVQVLNACGPNNTLSPVQSPAAGTTITSATTVTMTVDDGSGNISSCTFTVTPVDETAPECPAYDDITVAATAGCTAIATWTELDAADNCDGTVTGTQTAGPAPGSSFAAGSTTVEYTYTDAAGNSTVCSFTVTVDHGQAPLVVCDAVTGALNSNGETFVDAMDLDEGSNSACGSDLIFDFTTDIDPFGGPTADATFVDGQMFTCDDLGVTEVILRVTDAVSGEFSLCLTTITIVDNTAPVLTNCPADVTVQTSNNGLNDCTGFAQLELFEATDNCEISYEFTITDPDGNVTFGTGQDASGDFETGTSTIVFTAVDAAGNRRTCPVPTAVTVEDDEAPLCANPDGSVVEEPGSLFVSLAAGNGQNGNVFDIELAEDLTLTQFFGHTNSTALTNWEIFIIDGGWMGNENNPAAWTQIADATGVTGQGTGSLTPIPLDAPVSLAAGTYGVAVFAPVGGVAYTNGATVGNVWATDGTLTVFEGLGGTALGGIFFQPRNFNGQIDYLVGMNAVAIADIEVDSEVGACGAIVEYETPNGFDNCDAGNLNPTLIAGLPSGSIFPVGTTTVSWLLTDLAGNETTCTFNVVVNDINAPMVTCPEDIEVPTDPGLCSANVELTNEVVDECADTSIEVCFEFSDSPETTSWELINSFGIVEQFAPAGTYTENACEILDVNAGDFTLNVSGFFGSYTVTTGGVSNTFTSDNTECDFNESIMLESCVEVQWLADGGFENEMGYEIIDSNGDVVASNGFGLLPINVTNGVPVTDGLHCLNGGETHTFRAVDSFGDGWNGNTLQLANPSDGSIFDLQDGGTTTTIINVFGTDPAYTPTGNLTNPAGTNPEFHDYEFTTPSVTGPGQLCITTDVLGAGVSATVTNLTTGVVEVSAPAGTFGNDDSQCFTINFVAGDEYELDITGLCGADASFEITDPSGAVTNSGTGGTPVTSAMFSAASGIGEVTCIYTITDEDGNVLDSGPGQTESYTLTLVTTGTFNEENTWDFDDVTNGVNIVSGAALPDAPGTIQVFDLDFNTEYNFSAFDSFGDGWNGQTVSFIGPDGETTVWENTSQGGSSDILSAPANTSAAVWSFTTPANSNPGDALSFDFPLGTSTVTWVCTDLAGNSSSCSTTVTVNDEEDPTITCPEDINVAADLGDCDASLTVPFAVVTDNADPCLAGVDPACGDREITIVDSNSDNSFPAEHGYVVLDPDGNVVTANGFGLGLDPAGTVLETASLTPGVTYTFAAVDDFGDGWDGFGVQLFDADGSVISVTKTNGPEAGTTFDFIGGAPGTTNGFPNNFDTNSPDDTSFNQFLTGGSTVRGNVGLYEFSIATLPACELLPTDAVTVSTITFPDGSTATDDGDVTADFPIGTTTIEYTATDAAGNSSSCTTTVTVEDDQDPICNAPAVQAVYFTDPGVCEACITLADFTSADNCGVAFSGHNSTFADAAGENASGCYPVGTHTVKYFANDWSGNACVTEITFEVVDGEAPTAIIAPADLTVCNDPGTCNATNVDLGAPSFDDNCGVASVSNDAPTLYILGENTITWTVTDEAGNTSTYTQVITVEDCDAPMVDCPEDIVASTETGECEVTIPGLDVEISDNCEIPLLFLEICTDENSELTSYEVSSGSTPNLVYELVYNTTGGFQTEVGYELLDSQGTIVASDGFGVFGAVGETVATFNLMAGETYTFRAIDSFGDGWNGNTFLLDDAGNTVTLNDVTSGGTTTVITNLGTDPVEAHSLPGGSDEVHTYTFTVPADTFVSLASGDAGDLAGNDGQCTLIPLPSVAGTFDVCVTNLFGTWSVVDDAGTVFQTGSGLSSQPISATLSAGPVLEYSMVVATAGAFDNEVGWELVDSNGNTIATWEGDVNPLPTGAGDVVQTWPLSFGETYTLTAIDSFGDGWNGNSFMVDDAGNSIVLNDITDGGTTTTVIVNATDPAYTGTLFPNGNNPEAHIYEFTTPAGPTVTVDLDLTPATIADELAWELVDGTGAVVASAAAGTYAGTEGSTTTESLTLPASSYTLNIDGLGVGGLVEASEDGATILSESQGDLEICDQYTITGASFSTAYTITFPDGAVETGTVTPFDGTFPVGESTIEWIVTDENGNVSDPCTTTITINDTNLPEFSAPNTCASPDDAPGAGGQVNFGTALELPLNISADLTITNLNDIEITGMFNNNVSSLDMFLQSPTGTTVQIFEGSDYPACGFLFQGFTFADGGASASDCPGSDGLLVNPSNPITNAFNGEPSQGTWTLIVSTDDPTNNGGVVFGWNMEVCGDESACAPDQTVSADENCEATLTLPIPNAIDCDALSFFYSMDGGISRTAIAGSDVTLTFPLGTSFVTWIVRDEAGNEIDCGTQITVEDTTAPLISCPADATASSGQFNCEAPISLALATADDNCSAPTITNDSPYAVSNGADASGMYPVGVTVVTFTATDDAGNTTTCTTTVTVTDDEAPIISCGSTLNFNLPIEGTLEVPAQLFAAAVFDNCGTPTILIEGNSTITFDCSMVGLNEGLTVTAVDASGNTAECWIDVLIKDEIAIECTGGSISAGVADCVTGEFEITPDNYTAPTFTDNAVFATCPWTVETTVNGVAGPIDGFYPAGTYEVCWTATAADGTTATCCDSFTVEPAGTFTCPSDVTVDADANCEGFATLVLADNCVEPLSVTNDYNAGGADASGTYPLGSTTVTFSIVDAWGNTSTCSATVTVEDNEAPTIECPAGATASADAGLCETAIELDLATAADNCSVTITNDYNAGGADASGVYPVGTTTVTFTATDGAGNTTTCSIDVTVTDDEAPVCNAPESLTLNASDDGFDCGAYTGLGFAATPTDNCGIASVAHDSPFADAPGADASGIYPVGTTTVTFVVTDVNGNTSSCTATVTVIDDLGPAITCPADVTVCNDLGACGATLSMIASSDENCDIDRIDYTITFEDGAVAAGTSTGQPNTHFVDANGFYPVGTHSIEYVAYDLSGNSASCTTTVTVEDCEAPTCNAQDIEVALDADGNATITAAMIDGGSTDNCGIASISAAPTTFDCSNTGANTVTLTVTDVHGLVSTCEAIVTVVENEAPECAAQDITVELDAAGQATITAAMIDNGSTDNCAVNLSIDNDSFNCNDLGANTVMLTVSDNSGNSSTCSATVTVEDNLAPVITCDAAVVDSCAIKGECGAFVVFGSNATDNCSVIITNDSPYADAAGGDASGYYPVGTHTVTFTAVDPAGNSSTCSTTVNVSDCEAPNVICVEFITATLVSEGTVIIPACAIDNGSFDNCTFSGNGDCAQSDLTYLVNGQSEITMDCSNLGLNMVTLTVIDEAGNSASCEAFVDVQDLSAPVIDCGPQSVFTAAFDPAASCGAFVTLPVPTVDDLCPGVTLTNDYNGTADASDEYPVGTTTVTWTATDAAGNSSTCSVDVVVDNIPAASNLGSDCNGSQFRLTWNPVAGTAGYRVVLRRVGGPVVGSVTFLNPNKQNTGWVDNSLIDPAFDYEFRVITGCLLDPTSNPNNLANYATAFTAWTPVELPCTPAAPSASESITEVSTENTTGKLVDLDDNTMLVYPNPNIGQFTIETDLDEYALEILDMTGKVIFREVSLTTNVYRAELSTVESGVYFVRLTGNDTVLTRRVVIER